MDTARKALSTALHGDGIYYFRFTGARQQTVFRSVFEYDYATRLLSSIEGCRLMAYMFTEHEVHCVMHCDRDWPGVTEDIREAFADLHEKLWENPKAVLSEEVLIALIDEHACLADLVITLHLLPVSRMLVADPSLYPWSSDHYFRQQEPPQWLDVGRVLNQLCQTRHNRAQRYEAAMAAPDKKILDLSSDTASGYLVFGRDAFIQKQMSSANIAKAERSQSELERLKEDAIGLIAERFDMTSEAMTDRTFRRQYHRLMPLVAWLLQKRDLTDETIADLLGEDEDQIPIWIRGIKAEHPQALTDRLSALWTPTQSSSQNATPNKTTATALSVTSHEVADKERLTATPHTNAEPDTTNGTKTPAPEDIRAQV